MKYRIGTVICICLALFSSIANAQELIPQELSLNDVIARAMQHHQQLKISQANMDVSEQQIKVAKLQQLPSATLSANGFYLSDATLYSTELDKIREVKMPHFGNTYALQASQLLSKGGMVNKSIQIAELRMQLAELDLKKDEQSIKFLVISNYLDIYKLHNQLKVYEQNKKLAQIRLENLTKMSEEQMITRNELIRAELLIKNIEQAILTLNNNLAILSNQMSYALGLPQNILIIPTEQIDNKIVDSIDKYIEMAHLQHQALATATTNINFAKKSIGISKAEYYPTIAAFAGYNMQRPMTSVQPAVDLYANTWQSGISVSFNIDNLYKTKQKIRLGEQQGKMAEEAFVLIEQNVNISVYAAYTKYQEALKQSEIMTEAKKLATENYNIVEAKYLNQLAITAEMTDAANARLEAELQHINSTITVLFQYYNLIKSTGTL